jgi:hypothetical protein
MRTGQFKVVVPVFKRLLVKILDGSLGQWRLDGGTHQIFLFTDSPAKDYVLADYVTALAHNVGATIASTAIATLAGGAVNTFNLVGSSLTETTQVQIYTVFTGAAGTDTAALASIMAVL